MSALELDQRVALVDDLRIEHGASVHCVYHAPLSAVVGLGEEVKFAWDALVIEDLSIVVCIVYPFITTIKVNLDFWIQTMFYEQHISFLLLSLGIITFWERLWHVNQVVRKMIGDFIMSICKLLGFSLSTFH